MTSADAAVVKFAASARRRPGEGPRHWEGVIVCQTGDVVWSCGHDHATAWAENTFSARVCAQVQLERIGRNLARKGLL